MHWVLNSWNGSILNGEILKLNISTCMWACQSSAHWNTERSFANMGHYELKVMLLLVEIWWTHQANPDDHQIEQWQPKNYRQKPLRKLKILKMTWTRNFTTKQEQWINRTLTYIYNGYYLIVDLNFVLVLLVHFLECLRMLYNVYHFDDSFCRNKIHH